VNLWVRTYIVSAQHVYQSRLHFPSESPRIPEPGNRMYGKLREALSGYRIDSNQVIYRPPQPRLSDACLELALADEDVVIQFTYDVLTVTINEAKEANPEEISAVLDALYKVVSSEMPNGELNAFVFIGYGVHASILTRQPSNIFGALEGNVSIPGLQIQRLTFRLPTKEADQRDIWVEVGTSEKSPHELLLDYSAFIDKAASTSLVAVVSEAFKAREDLLEKLNLRSDGNEEFASWFVTSSVKG
jgi:hypothetical protein